MKVIQINSVCDYGSTGKIVGGISDVLTQNGVENYILYTIGHSARENAIKCGNLFYARYSALKSRIFGEYGFNSAVSTGRIIKNLKKLNPDKLILHNIHSHDCNLETLFKYIKKNNIDTYWVLHDCWSFTGYCVHFDSMGCQKWQTECDNCEQFKEYSLFFDKSKKLYNRKKAAYMSYDKLTVITPSEWLAGLVKKSFLKDRPVTVINNGIDLNAFKYTDSDFKKKYGIENKKIVLGIPKGNLKYFLELSRLLSNEYIIVLVGLNGGKSAGFPENIIGVPYTKSKTELAKIYSAAEVFVNTTLADTFPTVNIESLACGTPVITFNTGGSPEIIDEETGSVVKKEDVEALKDAILKTEKTDAVKEACIKRAESRYNEQERFQDYYKLLSKK